MRRATAVLLAVGVLTLGGLSAASAQAAEAIRSYDVAIEIRDDGNLLITETIDYDFGSSERHGIFRDVPTRLSYDDTNDRVYRLEVVSVTATGAPDDVEVTEEGTGTHIRIGDPDVTVSGRHTYTIVYRVEGALNGFPDHDELFWNAIGNEWDVPIDTAQVIVRAPAGITRRRLLPGLRGLHGIVRRVKPQGPRRAFQPSRSLQPFEGMTVVVALPKGAVPEPDADPRRALGVRASVQRERRDGRRVGRTARGARVRAQQAVVANRPGPPLPRLARSTRSTVRPTGGDEAVPIGEGDAEAPVEFAPPEELRPGQIGTLIDERANVLDVTATIVDLATRGYLVIHEIPKEGWFGKADWRLARQPAPGEELLRYESRLLDAIFEGVRRRRARIRAQDEVRRTAA